MAFGSPRVVLYADWVVSAKFPAYTLVKLEKASEMYLGEEWTVYFATLRRKLQ